MATWTLFLHDDAAELNPLADTTVVRDAQTGGQVGQKNGSHVIDGRVDILKLWHCHSPGDMHADPRKLNFVGLSKRADFRQVSPAEFATLWV
jgi:hypothetical protein